MFRTHFGQHDGGCYGCKLTTVQFGGKPSFQPHFNWAVGSHVNSRQDFEDKMKEASDVASERLGIDHNFQPNYDLPKEPPYRADDGILDTAARIIHDV